MCFKPVQQLQEKAVPVDQMCRVLEVSRPGYYATRRRGRSQPAVCEASVQLKAASAASGGAYGSRCLRTAVAARGIVMGIYRLRRLMCRHGVRSAWQRKFWHTTDSKHTLAISPKVLGRQFNPSRPNQAWVADITYIQTRSGWPYRVVPGSGVGPVCAQGGGLGDGPGHAGHSGVPGTAVGHRSAPSRIGVVRVFGSRQPVRQRAHQALLAKHGSVGSMSRKGNCWDNAVMEHFLLGLQMERVWPPDHADHAEATRGIADYIVNFYNFVRLHSTLGNLPPNAFKHHASRINRQSNNLSACAK